MKSLLKQAFEDQSDDLIVPGMEEIEICEFAERMEQNGHTCEPAADA